MIIGVVILALIIAFLLYFGVSRIFGRLFSLELSAVFFVLVLCTSFVFLFQPDLTARVVSEPKDISMPSKIDIQRSTSFNISFYTSKIHQNINATIECRENSPYIYAHIPYAVPGKEIRAEILVNNYNMSAGSKNCTFYLYDDKVIAQQDFVINVKT